MSKVTIAKPIKLEEMIQLSELLAKDISHVRVDWYLINDRIYFGEITFFDGSGFEPFDDYSHDSFLGSLIKI